MKVEQILYTRVGASELGAGWQSRKSERFDTDAEKGCMYQFNRIVDSMLDKAKVSPTCLYAKWNSGKRICTARAKKIEDRFGRGNILAHAYAVSDSEYISVLSKPAEFICINDFADEIIEKPAVLDALPPSENISLKEVCRKYSITADKMKQLVCLVLSSVLRRSSNGIAQRKSLKIVVDVKSDDLYCASREIMTAVYSFMPCVMRLNTSFASYAHKQLEGMSVLFTNERQDDYYFDIITGDCKWPAEFMIPVPDMARVFVENRANSEFQRDIENYVLQIADVYNIQWNDMLAAYLYASLKNNIEVSVGEDELFKALASALKVPHSSVQEEYIAELVKYYVGTGGKIAPGHAEQIVARYSKLKDENLRDALDYYNFSNYVLDFSDQKFIGFCMLQKSAPDAYERTIKNALEAGSKEFLNKVGSDIAKSKETYAAFINAVSDATKSEMYNYMIKNMYLCEDGSGHVDFYDLNKRVSALYGELHGMALRTYTDGLKKYYADFVIPNTAVSFEFLMDIKRTFGADYDINLSGVLTAAAVRTFEKMCKNGESPEKYIKFRSTLYELGCSGEELERCLENGKRAFWDNFSLSSWDVHDSYRAVESFEYPISKIVSNLETMVYNIQTGEVGDSVYSDVARLLDNDTYTGEARTNILEQLIEIADSKAKLNVEDVVIKSIRPQDGRIDTQRLGMAIADERNGFRGGDITRSVLWGYVVRHCRPEQTKAMYEMILSQESPYASKAASGFNTLCSKYGLSLDQVKNEIMKRSARDFNTVAFMLMFTAITVGMGIGMAMDKSGINGYGRLLAAVIKAATACIAALAISIPVLKIQNKTEGSIIKTMSAVIYVLALITFGMSAVLWKL